MAPSTPVRRKRRLVYWVGHGCYGKVYPLRTILPDVLSSEQSLFFPSNQPNILIVLVKYGMHFRSSMSWSEHLIIQAARAEQFFTASKLLWSFIGGIYSMNKVDGGLPRKFQINEIGRFLIPNKNGQQTPNYHSTPHTISLPDPPYIRLL
jgi:hypothetical protein